MFSLLCRASSSSIQFRWQLLWIFHSYPQKSRCLFSPDIYPLRHNTDWFWFLIFSVSYLHVWVVGFLKPTQEDTFQACHTLAEWGNQIGIISQFVSDISSGCPGTLAVPVRAFVYCIWDSFLGYNSHNIRHQGTNPNSHPYSHHCLTSHWQNWERIFYTRQICYKLLRELGGSPCFPVWYFLSFYLLPFATQSVLIN